AQPNFVFFVDGGKSTISANADSLAYGMVKGGQTQKDYIEYRAGMADFGQKQQRIYADYNKAQAAGDQTGMQNAQAEFNNLGGQVKQGLKDFIKTHPKSIISGYIIHYEYNNPTV